jgi:hypothetical protein
MKPSKLIGDALDWAVDKALNLNTPYNSWGQVGKVPAYSTDWAQGGLVIQKNNICLWSEGYDWEAKIQAASGQWIGEWDESPLIAAMRCYVTSKLGDEINLPQHLLRGELT